MSAMTASAASSAFATEHGDPPRVLSPLEQDLVVPEGDPVHLEIRVSPPGDLQVQWFKDNTPLSAGSRFNTICERGFASLDIIYTIPEDTGMYSCVISNPFGIAKVDPTQVNIIPEVEQNHDQFDAQHIDFESAYPPSREYEQDQRSMPKVPPQFQQQPIISDSEVAEGSPVRMEAMLLTTSDNTLQVQWMHDGKPVGTGSRFNEVIDRGLIVLEIGYCLAEDSGTYTCVATNALGQVQSNPVILNCQPEARIVTKSILDPSSISHLKQLEEPGEEYAYLNAEPVQGIPPVFKAGLEPSMIQVTEDEPALFCVPVDTGNGDRLTVEWRRDGQIVKTGSRITGKLELGVASLKIHYTQPTDSGTYTCHVTTEHGHADSSQAQLACEASCTIDAASQLPGDKEKGLQAIQTLEANLNAPRGAAMEDDGPAGAPQIVRQLQSVGEVEEGTNVHFEVQVEPSGDASLCVDWYKDDRLLSTGTRFRVTYERGLAILDLLYTIPEDSGDYWCLVRNSEGQIESSRVPLHCNASASVITHSNLLQGSEGYNLIKAIEESGDAVDGEYRYEEQEEPDCPPNFDVLPQATTIGEASPVRFLVRVSGKPTPTLAWYLNDEAVVQDSMTKIYSDGAINYLEMTRCPALQGSSRLHVTAVNPLGQKDAEIILTVVPAEDFRPDLKHVQPENPFKKMMGLRKVNCTPELNKALTRSKPSAQTILEMERGTEMKARNYRSPEVIEAEKMLDQLALSLRKSERKPPSGAENTGQNAIGNLNKTGHYGRHGEDGLPPPPPDL